MGELKGHTGLWLGNLKVRDHLEYKIQMGGHIQVDLKEIGWEGLNWIYQA
jgi:hypothetical protein